MAEAVTRAFGRSLHRQLSGGLGRSVSDAARGAGGGLLRFRSKALMLLAATSASAVAAAIAVPSAQASSSFIPGSAGGVAQSLQIAPRTGGFAYTISVGNAIADFRGTLAQAESQVLDLGLIGTALTAQSCSGGNPLIQSSQLPQPLIAESSDGDHTESHDEAGSSQSGVLAAAGHEQVTVTKTPSSAASFDGGTIGFNGLLTASGMSTASTSKLIPGQARLATADASIGQLSFLGGIVVLKNMHWSASLRTGTKPSMSGTFTIGDAVIAGHEQAVGPASAGSVLNAVNALIAASGLHLTPPTIKKNTTGGLTISPLTLGIDNSQLGATVVNPLNNATQPEQQQLVQILLGINCQFATPLLLEDIAVGAADGTGSADLLFGGVSVSSNAVAYSNPFGSAQLGTSSGQPLGGVSSPATAAGSGGVGSSLPAGGTVGAAPGNTPQLAGQAQVTQSCATTSPAHWPACSNGAALAAGLLGLVAVVGVGGADFFVMRRRRHLPELDL
ncbi:MAG TPA: hypothetical protein VFH54_14460 [Mycobacteriales bacterium]|nr:hypothetical protein [Mycobacteriales bacterium]